MLKAKIFNAEIYALGLAYTLSLLILSGACGEGFISSLTHSDDDDGHHDEDMGNPMCGQFTFLYPVIITALLTIVHSMNIFEKAAGLGEEGEKGDDEKEEDELVGRQSIAAYIDLNAVETSSEAASISGHGHHQFEDMYTRAGNSLKSCCAPMDELFCSQNELLKCPGLCCFM